VAQTNEDDVKKHFREEQSKHLQQTVGKYKEQGNKLKATVKGNPMLPLKERIENSGQILVQVLLLTQTWNEVMPYIRKIKSLIDGVLARIEPSPAIYCLENSLKAWTPYSCC